MTDTYRLTYEGSLRRGFVSLPTRRVTFERGAAVEFTAAETSHLDTDWTGPRPEGPGGERTGTGVPLGETGTVIDDGHGPALAIATGAPLGRIAEVLPLATTPERARALLDAEVSTKNRPKLVAKLTELAGAATDPAATATDTNSEEA